MRLWTLHPGYLDTKGLLAVWREGLLAQKVLLNQTRGYRHHPQLRRFAAAPDVAGAIAAYLHEIHREALRRGYRFNETKINPAVYEDQLPCTRGQVMYEWAHLQQKLQQRDPARYRALESIHAPQPHPLFRIVEGEPEEWEVGARGSR